MAEPFRNEVDITLAGQTRTMRAKFSAIRGIERDLKINLLPLMDKLGRGDVGIEQASVIIFHGLHGNADTRMKLEDVGEAVMEAGLSAIIKPIVDFLAIAMEGVTLGKPQESV